MLEKEKLGVQFFFPVLKFYTQQISWKCRIENWNKNISW